MAKEEIDRLFRGFYESLNQGDLDNTLALCDPAVEVYKDPGVVAVIAPRGHKEVATYLRSWLDTWDEYRPEPEEFVESGDQVVALVHLRARGKGSRFQIEEDVADVFTVKDGKIATLRLYVERGRALESAGLES